MLGQIEKAGFTDIKRRIRYERLITPSDWDQQYEIHRGATFNLTHSLDQMLHLRPRNRFEDLDGVYLVGGGTHPGSGLPVIFESARISARLLLADLGFPAGAPPAPRPRLSRMIWKPYEGVLRRGRTGGCAPCRGARTRRRSGPPRPSPNG